MLYLAYKFHQLNFAKLMEVYAEGNKENGKLFFPELSENEQLLRAEQSFCRYLSEIFFRTDGALCAVWEEEGCYCSALRLEPYQDGLLLEALETAPAFRRRGCATALLRAVRQSFPGKIYSHVHRQNTASLAIHRKCGFVQVLDYARYIDGSVARNAVTLLWE